MVPLCDQHFAPMRSNSTLRLTFHGCTGDQFCERRYDALIGYYGGTSPTETYRVACGTHFCTLFVCAYDADRQIRRYACPMEGCKNITEWRS
jgi:hypothetical protein